MHFKKRQVKRLNVDITPLVDVIFLLLIFLLISTTFINAPGIKVNLPSATIKKKELKKTVLEVSITKNNKIYLNGKIIAAKKLRNALESSKKGIRQANLIIRADGKVQHRIVVMVMDAAKQAGIHKLSIATKLKSLPEP